jgi:hypothetical protein
MAIRFGRTLQSGCIPLIEQIARVSTPQLTADLVRYQRRLTAIWCAYLVLSALFVLISSPTVALRGVSVGLCSVVLFLSEHWLRSYFFSNEKFPSISCQLRDTVQVFRRRAPAKSTSQSKSH